MDMPLKLLPHDVYKVGRIGTTAPKGHTGIGPHKTHMTITNTPVQLPSEGEPEMNTRFPLGPHPRRAPWTTPLDLKPQYPTQGSRFHNPQLAMRPPYYTPCPMRRLRKVPLPSPWAAPLPCPLHRGHPLNPRRQYCTIQYCTIQYCTIQYCTIQYCTIQYCTIHYCTIHYCTIQYCTIQYCTIQYCTIQYSTVWQLNNLYITAGTEVDITITVGGNYTLHHCTVYSTVM
jgi:hypothetical protein